MRSDKNVKQTQNGKRSSPLKVWLAARTENHSRENAKLGTRRMMVTGFPPKVDSVWWMSLSNGRLPPASISGQGARTKSDGGARTLETRRKNSPSMWCTLGNLEKPQNRMTSFMFAQTRTIVVCPNRFFRKIQVHLIIYCGLCIICIISSHSFSFLI